MGNLLIVIISYYDGMEIIELGNLISGAFGLFALVGLIYMILDAWATARQCLAILKRVEFENDKNK